jgi:hypothetical protein
VSSVKKGCHRSLTSDSDGNSAELGLGNESEGEVAAVKVSDGTESAGEVLVELVGGVRLVVMDIDR